MKTKLPCGQIYAILERPYLNFKNTCVRISEYRQESSPTCVYHLRGCQRWLNRLEYKFARVSNVTMTTAVVGMQGGENGVEV